MNIKALKEKFIGEFKDDLVLLDHDLRYVKMTLTENSRNLYLEIPVTGLDNAEIKKIGDWFKNYKYGMHGNPETVYSTRNYTIIEFQLIRTDITKESTIKSESKLTSIIKKMIREEIDNKINVKDITTSKYKKYEYELFFTESSEKDLDLIIKTLGMMIDGTATNIANQFMMDIRQAAIKYRDSKF